MSGRNNINHGNIVPSHSEEAERAVIGAMLNRQRAILEAREILNQDSFFNRKLGFYFRIICDLADEGVEIDTISVAEELNRHGECDSSTAIELSEIAESAPFVSNISHHAKIVFEKHLKRQTAIESYSIYNRAIDSGSDPLKLIEEAQSKYINLYNSLNFQTVFTPEKTEKVYRQYLQDISEGKVKAIKTGFRYLDSIIGGLIAPDLIIIGARTQIGKTSLAMSIIHNIAIVGDTKVGIFSLEMAPLQLAAFKLMAYYTNHDVNDLRFGYQKPDSDLKMKREEFWQEWTRSKIYIDDTSRLTDIQFYNKAKQMKMKFDVDVIFVDYIQLMNSDARQREEQLANVSKMMKETAKELNVPIVALAQLNREADKFDDTEPKLNQIRYSGAIEQDADIIILIERPGAYGKDTFGGQKPETAKLNDNNDIAKLHVKKNRLGPGKSCKVKFQKNIGMYQHLESEEYVNHTVDFSYPEPEEMPF